MGGNPYIQDAGIERFAGYRPGGFHPVHLGDKFKDGRYTVLNKLGYGSYSTVWLVRDELRGTCASLKILSADASESSTGTELDVLRRSAAGSGEGKRHVLQFLDDFIHQGPNGAHLCIVTEVSGPSLSSYLEGIFSFDEPELPPTFARLFTIQLARGVEYLHSCGIVHGDLHLGNILYHSSAFTLDSDDDIRKYFGEPETTEIRLIKGAEPPYNPPHVPQYVVYAPDHSLFLEPFFENPSAASIKICDFSEASLLDPAHPEGIKRELNCPNVHAAPEVIFDNLASPASDIWAMGNTMHQILTGGGTSGSTFIPGAAGCSKDEVLCEMVCLLGKLPEKWWARWEARSKYYDEDGWPIAQRHQPKAAETGRKALADRIPGFYLSDKQKMVFEKVLEGIYLYEAHDRWRASDIVKELEGWEALSEGPEHLHSAPAA